MTDAAVLAQINAAQEPGKKTINAWVLLAVSLIAFAGLGVFRWDLVSVILLAVVIFIHELGHLAAMKLYRYKNLKMLFLPFIGGAASGEPREHDAYKIAMIALFGPLVGFLSAIAAVLLGVATQQDVFGRYALLALVVNAFNLLPILPLDGGHFLNETLFNRFPKVELGFKVLAIAGLGYLAYALQSWILGVIGFFVFVTLGVSYKMARAAQTLRNEEGMKGGDLTEEKVARIRQVVREANPQFESERNLGRLPNVVRDMWLRVNKVFPSVPRTVALVLVYLVVALGLPGFTLGFMHGALGAAPFEQPDNSGEQRPEPVPAPSGRIAH